LRPEISIPFFGIWVDGQIRQFRRRFNANFPTIDELTVGSGLAGGSVIWAIFHLSRQGPSLLRVRWSPLTRGWMSNWYHRF
jgi:hypothetical protein